MNAHVRPAMAADIKQICQLLHEKMNSKIPLDRWRNLMSYRWLEDKPDYGRVVESSGRILGFCGMVYSDRQIGKTPQSLRKERMVSMSSWYLDKSVRGKGLGRDMLMSAIENPLLTYSTLTNSRKPLAIVEALGFQVLESKRYVWKKAHSAEPAMRIVKDPLELLEQVEPIQRQLLEDMRSQPLMPVYLIIEKRKLLLFFSVKSKGSDVLWFDVMYVSDLNLFSEYAQALANQLLPDAPSVLAADSRFVTHANNEAMVENLPVSRYFISNRVKPHEIDHLYSELQLLDLKLD